ncbi:uncharacterized protein LOC106674252 [Cimex lectularius]|uniref:Peptidase S1 domain-containing protein n=1 Tax=Cimex lectularius TaxID=79782 RepID=A0A8I6SJ29_CIMLE|nr:uncharacterized protein LOC106674252 [Cimex lectularius]
MFLVTVVLGIVTTICTQPVETFRSAYKEEFPFMGYMNRSNIQTCALVIISTRKFVTAAHCLMSWDWDNIQVFLDLSRVEACAGSRKLRSGYCRNILEYKVSKNYARGSRSHIYLADIGVGHLEEPFELSKTIMPVTIVSPDPVVFKKSWDDIVNTGTTCITMGWSVVTVTSEYEHSFYVEDYIHLSNVQPWNDTKCRAADRDRENMVSFGGICISCDRTELTRVSEEGSALYCNGKWYAVMSDVGLMNERRPGRLVLLADFIKELNISHGTSVKPTKVLVFVPPILLYVYVIKCILG